MRNWLTAGTVSILLWSTIGAPLPAIATAPIVTATNADQLYQQGLQQEEASQFDAALASWQQALQQYRTSNQRLLESQTLQKISAAYDAIGEYDQAIEYSHQSLMIANELEDRPVETDALGQLGIAYRSLGDYQQAIRYHEESLEMAIEIQDRRREGNALGNLGMDYYALGDYKKAIDYHQKRLAIAIEIKDEIGRGNAMSNLGNAYRSIGDYDQAIKHHQQRLEIAIATKDKRAEGQALGYLGLVYRSLGKYDQAITFSEKGLAIAQSINDRQGVTRSLGYLGSTYYSRSQANRRRSPQASEEDYKIAIDFHKKSLAQAIAIKDRRSQGKSYGYLGAAYESRGDYAAAIQAHEQSLIFAREVDDQRGEGKTLTSLGIAYDAIGKPQEAVNYHRQSLAIRQKINDRFGAGMSWKNLGTSLFKQNQLTEAESSLRHAIRIWESLRSGLNDSNKISLAETQAAVYPVLQEILIRQNRPDAALEVAEQGRARAFAELLARKLGNQTQGDRSTTALTPPNLDEIRAIARQQNATLVEYSQINAETLYIWVVKPNSEITFRTAQLDAQQPIRKLIARSRSIKIKSTQVAAVNPVPQEPSVDHYRSLYDQLIAPIAQDLPKQPNDRVIFLPQGELFLVPFPALQNAAGKFLIEQHTISTAPSIQTLQLTHEKAKHATHSGTALVVGNPTMPMFDNQQLDALPGAEAEAIAISQILKTQPLIGNQATKPAVLAQMRDAPIIHLATHGLLNTLKGDIPGAIALAPSGQDNGLLSASELFDLSLSADLAVLSACDTGRGEITGDGVVGLSRSLIAAGVPSVIVSLWAVDDASTRDLMGNFYQSLNRHPNKAQALRSAMLTTMQKYPDPNYWAAFTLIGESDRPRSSGLQARSAGSRSPE
jgi:CHAT domain-containing protein/Flp pilus assembly protein TadD